MTMNIPDITVKNNADEALKMAKELLVIAKKNGDPAIIASRQRQVRYWTEFLRTADRGKS